ncbi:MAG TPA: CNNM domain-containing protein [Gemmatimonadaceae bacterium]|nr:CNNM domain-containing protein [Gemmatimonadaceae bacterium]
MTTTTLLMITVGIVAWLTAAATAVRSVSRIWLRHWVEQQLSGSGAAALYLEKPHGLLLAASTGVALTVFVSGVILANSAQGSIWMLLLESLIFALVLLVAGQLAPRAIAKRWAPQLIPVLLPPLQALEMILSPALRFVRRLAGERQGAAMEPPPTDEETLEELLREGELEGVGEAGEIAIISGVVQFGEKRVTDVMVPRSEIFALPQNMPAGEMATRVSQSKYSRVPIYRDSIDNIIGMVHVFDMLKNSGTEVPSLRPVSLTRPVTSCKELLSSMLRERRQMAIVRDDAGGTVGLLTLEDLLEELVGDIRDEHDEPAAMTPVAAPPSRAT